MNALQRNVTGKIKAQERSLDVPSRHQLRIARDTMTKNCTFAVVVGIGHRRAARVIHDLTGAVIGIDADCTCPRLGDAFAPLNRTA